MVMVGWGGGGGGHVLEDFVAENRLWDQYSNVKILLKWISRYGKQRTRDW